MSDPADGGTDRHLKFNSRGEARATAISRAEPYPGRVGRASFSFPGLSVLASSNRPLAERIEGRAWGLSHPSTMRGARPCPRSPPASGSTARPRKPPEFYVSLLPNSRIDHVQKNVTDSPAGKAGSVLVVEFTLAGQRYLALNGGTRCRTYPCHLLLHRLRRSGGGRPAVGRALQGRHGPAMRLAEGPLRHLLADRAQHPAQAPGRSRPCQGDAGHAGDDEDGEAGYRGAAGGRGREGGGLILGCLRVPLPSIPLAPIGGRGEIKKGERNRESGRRRPAGYRFFPFSAFSVRRSLAMRYSLRWPRRSSRAKRMAFASEPNSWLTSPFFLTMR